MLSARAVKAALALVLLVLSVGRVCAQVPPVPPKERKLVYDYAGVMAAANEAALERKLEAYNDSTGTQIAIVIEQNLPDGTPFDRSFAIADAWGIGGGTNDNGILIYAAIDNRQLWIQTGYGVEDRVTDAMSRRIVDQVIAPRFRTGQYYEGLDRATSVMADLLAGRYKADPRQAAPQEGLGPVQTLLLFVGIFFIISWLMSRRGGDDDGDDGGYYKDGRYQGSRRRRRGGGWVVLPGGGFGGGFGGGGFGGGGGGGGGGFGGFGGGGFGGGGAGGGW